MVTLDDRSSSGAEKYYAEMVRARHGLVFPLAGLTLAFFFLQQVLTNFTSALDGLAFSGMTWAYVYAFAQFFFVVIVTTYYRRRMQQVERDLAGLLPAQGAAHYDDWTTLETHDSAAEGGQDEQFQHVQGARLDEEDAR